MFGYYQNIFRSRWKALIWAAGVLLTAYCSVPAPEDAAEPSTTEPTIQPESGATHHANPWALERPAK